MVCKKCNSETADNSKYCGVCGNPINLMEDVSPIIDNSMVNSNVVQESIINTNSVISNDNNYSNTNNAQNMNNQQTLNSINIEQTNQQSNNIEFNSSQQQQSQIGNTKNESSGLNIASALLGIIGIVVAFFHFITASIIFIIGIILGAIYKSKTKNKCFGLILNIICLILNIIFFFGTVFIINNTINNARKNAECAQKGGYMANGKCIGAISDKNNKREEEKYNNSNINDNSFNLDDTENNTYIGFWSCKDDGSNTSMSIEPLDQVDDSEYKIGLTFANNQKYTITYSSSKWEKGTYTINLNKKDSTGLIYYDLNLTIGELYESGNYQTLNSTSKNYQFVVNEFYDRTFLIASDGSINYSCYKD